MRSKIVLTAFLFCLLVDCARHSESSVTEAAANSPIRIDAPPSSTPAPQPTAAPETATDRTELDKLDADTFPFGDRVVVPDKLIKQMLSESKELRKCLKETYGNDLPKFSEPIVAESPDLNGDKIDEFIVSVENRCGGHNSPYFVYQSVGSGYKLLLNTTSNGIKLKKSETGGFRDLLVNSYGGMNLGGAEVYKFANGKYRAVECFEWRPYDEKAEKIKIQLKPHKCGEPT